MGKIRGPRFVGSSRRESGTLDHLISSYHNRSEKRRIKTGLLYCNHSNQATPIAPPIIAATSTPTLPAAPVCKEGLAVFAEVAAAAAPVVVAATSVGKT